MTTAGTGTGDWVALALVRHGETPLTPTGAYSGSGVPGPPLTAYGRAQVLFGVSLDLHPGCWPGSGTCSSTTCPGPRC